MNNPLPVTRIALMPSPCSTRCYEIANVRFGWKAVIAPDGAASQSKPMRETAPAVRSQNSALRDLMPFYSIGHFAFAAVLVVGVRRDASASGRGSLESALGRKQT